MVFRVFLIPHPVALEDEVFHSQAQSLNPLCGPVRADAGTRAAPRPYRQQPYYTCKATGYDRPVVKSNADCDKLGESPGLGRLALFFLKLGTIAFGGPAAHVAMMEDELVGRRKWVPAADFLDMLAVSNLIPGPSSTELAIYIGYRLRGLAGLVLAGTCFIAPAFFMVLAIAWAYVHYGHLPAVAGVLYGIKPVVMAVILQALARLATRAIKAPWLAAVGIGSLAAACLGVSPVAILAVSALIAFIVYRAGTGSSPVSPISALALLPAAAGPWPLFLVFLKLGCVVFGSGYVLLAFLQADLVVHRHWLTEPQLLDAVAVGQVTPGPVFTTATFIGYLIGGGRGAVLATAGIFAPAFVLVAATGPLIRRVRQSRAGGAVLDALNAASLGLMAAVTWTLARAAITDAITVILALAGVAFLLRFKLNSAWLIAGGAIVGASAMLLRR